MLATISAGVPLVKHLEDYGLAGESRRAGRPFVWIAVCPDAMPEHDERGEVLDQSQFLVVLDRKDVARETSRYFDAGVFWEVDLATGRERPIFLAQGARLSRRLH
jgi:hypothetical protein